MLDDQQYVHNLDHSNILAVIAGQPQQLKQTFELKIENSRIENIVLAGMGGSALAGEFVRAWLGDRLKVPFTITRDYSLPAFVGPNTLVVASSYSGNTEEALACLEDAKAKSAQIIVFTSGGKLAEAGQPMIQLPAGLPPRLAVFYGVRALAQLLEATGLSEGLTAELEVAADWVSGQVSAWTQEQPTASNQAKQIAQTLLGSSVVIYGGPTLGFAALKWKIDLNENAKNLAFSYLLPEFSHNEFNGWAFPKDKPFKVVQLQSSLDNPQIAKRWAATNRLLSDQLPKTIELSAEGNTKLEQLLWAVLLGDFVSAYLAFLNGIDPTPVDLIEKLKKELAS